MGRGVEMDGCGKCVRFLMFAINFAIWVGSLALLVLGVWTIVDRPYLEQLLGSDMYITSAYILIATGCIIFFVTFLGCFGALKEIKCMLLTYFILVLLLFICLLIGGALGYVFSDKATMTINNSMIATMKQYKEDKPSPIKDAWDETQQAMKCCGINDYGDWSKNNNGYGNKAGKPKVPWSCCKYDQETESPIDCTAAPTDENAYISGCKMKAANFVKGHALIIGGVGIAVALVMLLGLVLSSLLFKMIT
ncbi:unnamed protein product [Meganyctiphanes norvegica]|uniref:Tetraspanin n=1 Tax=Meganyctiphanes norvegica TaxID=48144 RepID=A0AAV2RDL0_MEGNR